ncbi:MAG: hypothetical protein AAFY42_07895 [Pseudomonadota bacterium]
MVQPSPIIATDPDTSGVSPIEAVSATSPVAAPQGWTDVRDDPEIQFDEFAMAPPEVREPGWFDDVWRAIAEFMSGLFGPMGEFIAINWDIVKWALLGLLAIFVIYWAVRTLGPLASFSRTNGRQGTSGAASDPQWQPSREESLELLEDADRLAAEGRFDEATHLLLKRSVNHIAKAQPDWVDPSSTARELAALPALSDPARSAFSAIAERVERSLFALRALDRSDWQAARAAYADFAGRSIGARAEVTA